MANDWIQLHDQPIDVAPVVQFVTDAQAGGIAVFLGTTRGEQNAAGHALAALEYDAYAEMARGQMEELGRAARKKWPVQRLVILHRTGRVAVGEPSVVIAVATPHRADAFAACRWIIDTLKADVAIWKKEVWEDGVTRWVDSGEEATRGRGDAQTR